MDCQQFMTSSLSTFEMDTVIPNFDTWWHGSPYCGKDVAMLDVENTGLLSSLQHHLVLHILSYLGPVDLAKLEATSSLFTRPAMLDPDHSLGLSELAAQTLCEDRSLIKQMKEFEKEKLKQRCGGSWKLLLQFLKAGERVRQHPCGDVVAGADHSVVVTKSGRVFTFGENNAGQLGHPFQKELWKPRPIGSLDEVRVIQAGAGLHRTLLVTDMGQVYALGKNLFVDTSTPASQSIKNMVYPEIVETLCGIPVVQVSLGYYFTAVLSQNGEVYTLSWGSEDKLGHASDTNDKEPHLLGGALRDIPVVQIAAGNCFLLALAYQPSGMSIYSLGCGQGGKLGHGNSSRSEKQPCRIEYFDKHLDFKLVAIAAGPWHAVALSEDGRVCTWGWDQYGCLGHKPYANQGLFSTWMNIPTIVDALADKHVKVLRIAAGVNATFAFADNGDTYGFGETQQVQEGQGVLITTFKERGEDVVRISKTNTLALHDCHTLALTASGRVYASGAAGNQLGRQVTNTNSSEDIAEIDFDFN